MHPSEDIYCTKSMKLKGKRIVLGVTGSIAAVETVRLCRELIRHGASVYPVMSESAERLISPDTLHFATGNEPVTRIDGRVQHIAFCGEVREKADLLLIAPSTANTISKIAYGIDDTPVTTFATTALGTGIPLLIVPAMHVSMYRHPILMENIIKLRRLGVTVMESVLEENKAKMPEIEDIVETVLRLVGRNDFHGKKVLVISGRTEEAIDDVRVITNRGSGRTGLEIAKAVFERGGNIELWCGPSHAHVPDYIPHRGFNSTQSVLEMVRKIRRFDVVVVPAAISDYTVKKQKGKIPSSQKPTLELVPTPKIVDAIGKKRNVYLVGFKMESGLSASDLVERAYERLRKSKMSLIIANRAEDVGEGSGHIFIIDKKKNIEEWKGSKTELAEHILDRISRDFR